MSNQTPEPSDSTTKNEDFLKRIAGLFGPNAEHSTLFDDVARRLAEQSASGELQRTTAHERCHWDWPPLVKW